VRPHPSSCAWSFEAKELVKLRKQLERLKASPPQLVHDFSDPDADAGELADMTAEALS